MSVLEGRHQLYFWELDLDAFDNCTVIVDIDGTLIGAGSDVTEEKVKKAIERLDQKNEVLLFSNHPDNERLKRIAAEMGISHITSFRRKPNPNIMRDVPTCEGTMVVIGDKTLTDGLFALFIGARFIKVRRVHHANDPLTTRLYYVLDDVASFFARVAKLRR